MASRAPLRHREIEQPPGVPARSRRDGPGTVPPPPQRSLERVVPAHIAARRAAAAEHRRAVRRRSWGATAMMALLLALFAGLGLTDRESGPLPKFVRSAVGSGGAAAPAGAPAVVPTPAQIDHARRFAAARRGTVAFAVVDTAGKLHGYRASRVFVSASVVKAMLMVAYLERLDRRGEPLTAWGRSRLGPMITRSDNDAATQIYNIVGNAGLSALARRAGMKRFVPYATWGNTNITAESQARFFRRIDGFVPRQFRDYARRLLQSVVPWQRWGIPQGAPPGYRILFKGGWRPTFRGRLVNQVAKLERGGRTLSIAVLTDGDPSHRYGTATVRGVAARLLR